MSFLPHGRIGRQLFVPFSPRSDFMQPMKARAIRTVLFCLFVLPPLLLRSQSVIMQWDFESITNRTCVEPGTRIADTLEGNFEIATGVVGNGLRLDGASTRIVRAGAHVKTPGKEFTVSAWVSLGEYPFNWSPVINTESSGVNGYRLTVGPAGQVALDVAVAER